MLVHAKVVACNEFESWRDIARAEGHVHWIDGDRLSSDEGLFLLTSSKRSARSRSPAGCGLERVIVYHRRLACLDRSAQRQVRADSPRIQVVLSCLGSCVLVQQLSRNLLQAQRQLDVAESSLRLPLRGIAGVEKGGPRAAAKMLSAQLQTEAERRAWAISARTQAIAGSIAGSKQSALSGLRAWCAFYSNFLKKQGSPLPPCIDDLLAWSSLFRHPRTFSNYLGYLRVGCELVGVSVSVFQHPSVRRAKSTIAKRCQFTHREPRFVRLAMIQDMMPILLQRPEEKTMLMLILAAYIFLLRVPSEALPMAVHSQPDGCVTPVVTVGADVIKLRLPKRKNRLTPSTMVRKCWCQKCRITCPVHILGEYVRALPAGVQPFGGITPHAARVNLRYVCLWLRTHRPGRLHAPSCQVASAERWSTGCRAVLVSRHAQRPR